MTRRILSIMVGCILLYSCSSSRKSAKSIAAASVKVTVDLVNVSDDKVNVTIIPPDLKSETLVYQFPKIIPGTYAIADYGRYIEDFKAFDKSGKQLPVSATDVNSYQITEAGQLGKITYQVNDTYDTENGEVFTEDAKDIFSPAGTNILAGKNFVLNMCGFAGYFDGHNDIPYQLTINHPGNLYGATSMVDGDPSNSVDKFTVTRFAELVDHPLMYAEPDTAVFRIEGMDVLLSVYSPRNKTITAKAFTQDLKKMVTAQKKFLGKINQTKKYAVICYITSMSKGDAMGIGALEHNTSTTAVFRDNMSSSDLIDVISHEFFHTLTPLNIHSKEIQFFDFNQPKMSEHLWMYEGVTEYFANLFQVNQGLISEDRFLAKIAEKERDSKYYSDTISFTRMSKNVLDEKMKAQYPNVYQKGALIAMCIDLIIRKNSNGERGILDIMGELSKIYGPDKPFDDNTLIGEFTRLTYPEVGEFLNQYVVNGASINYAKYLGYVGVTETIVKIPEDIVFLASNRPYLSVDTDQKRVVAVVKDEGNNFMNALGVQDKDVFLEMNGQPFDGSSIMNVLSMGYRLEEGNPVTLKILRNGQEMELRGVVRLNYVDGKGYKFSDTSKFNLEQSWLKGTLNNKAF